MNLKNVRLIALSIVLMALIFITHKVNSQSLTFQWPVFMGTGRGWLSQTYDSNNHPAIDIASSYANEPILAAADGVVVLAGDRVNDSPDGGTMIAIHHDTILNGQYYTWYAHLKASSLQIAPGNRVTKGQQIATMGNTGVATGVHLHFVLNTSSTSVLQGAIDPIPYLTGSPPSPTPQVSQVPSISQQGRMIMNDVSPPLGGTVRFEVTLKNNSSYPAYLREIFLRLYHNRTRAERKVVLWSGSELMIPAGGTWTFRVFSPVLDIAGAWQVHKIEMLHQPTGGSATWLPGIDQETFFVYGRTNIARGKPVIVHSVQANSGNVPAYLVDGSMTTRYESAWYDDQVILIDLGPNQKLDTIVLYWEKAFAKEFRVRINTNNCGSNKDACTWQEIASISDGKYRSYIVGINRRDVRWINIWLKKRGTSWGFSLWEVTAY